MDFLFMETCPFAAAVLYVRGIISIASLAPLPLLIAFSFYFTT
nr:hypothetical protein Q903MT_gene5309 [Picea sitchensis]